MFGRGDDATGKGNEGYTLPPTTNTIVLEQEKYCLRPHEGTYKGASVFFCTSPPLFSLLHGSIIMHKTHCCGLNRC